MTPEILTDELPSWVWLVAYAASTICLLAGAGILLAPARFRERLWKGLRWGLIVIVLALVTDATNEMRQLARPPFNVWLRFGVVAAGFALMWWLSFSSRERDESSWWPRWGRGITALVIAGVAFWGAQWRFEQVIAPTALDDALVMLAQSSHPQPILVADEFAYTDLGRPLPLYEFDHAGQADGSASSIPEPFEHRVIVHETGESPSNCHGWVFTGGRYLIRSELVDYILADNGYEVVHEPTPGDIVIYRNEQNEPVHTGLVKAVGNEGFVLIESKWGALDTYLHLPHDQTYSQKFDYYRTHRLGHLLHMPDAAIAARHRANVEHPVANDPQAAE